MKTILLATGNAKKGKELQELCADRFIVKTLKDVGLGDIDVVEDAPDFRGNAWKKARAIAAHVKDRGIQGIDQVIADDSGLVVDALDGHPGVRSARFARDAGYAPAGLSVDEANNRLLLMLLAPVPPERRTARFFSCVVALALDSDGQPGAEHEASGAVEGHIARDLLGAGGFGYDPLFVVDGISPGGKRMAELTTTEKHAISHRGRAMRLLLPRL